MIQTLPETHGAVLAFRLSGKLHDEDYRQFVPAVEAAIEQHGTVRLLVEFEDFHGWDAHALWDDIKFAAKHPSDVERIALVGEKTWEKWMATVCKPFTRAAVRYFDKSEVDAARQWVQATT